MGSDSSGIHDQTRRRFLASLWRGAGSAVVIASLPAWSEAMPLGSASTPPGRFRFPQGLASGDPTEDSVILWTRVEAIDGSTGPVRVRVEMSRDPQFTAMVAVEEITASMASDHTVRALVTGLDADSTYYYRFCAGDDVTPLLGRTRTAPAPTADRTARFAFASCQSYEAGYYRIWRALVEEDAQRAEAEQIDAVVHLGDFVYEALGYGGARRMPPFPDGGGDTGDSRRWARTLADYRHLYKTYLADPDLQAARARFPFIVTWDDHEFSDDAWQTTATYDNTDVPMPARKVAANQAWFEFIPARLSDTASADGVRGEAQDFVPVEVGDAVGEAALDAEITRAISSLAIYRAVRWGQHAELVITDTRSYRSDHPVPDALGLQISRTGRYFLPRHVVETFDAGRTANDGVPPAIVRVGESDIPNPRRDAAPGSMLGAPQKAWWKAVMRSSSATWKLWASSVPVMPVWFDVDALLPGGSTTVFSTDTWDGFPSERRELLAFLEAEQIANVVVLSGDNHNTFAGTLLPRHPDASSGVAVEFSVAGISSPSIFEAFAEAIAPDDPLRAIVVFDDTRFGGTDPRCAALNVTLRYGVRSAVALQTGGDVRRALAVRNPTHNPHLAYMDTKANGIGVIAVDGATCVTELWTFAPPLGPSAERLRTARFQTAARGRGTSVALGAPSLAGTPPFPDDRLR